MNPVLREGGYHLPRLLTASSLQRYAVCAASAVLPRVDSVHERTARGSWIHRFLERVAQLRREYSAAAAEGASGGPVEPERAGRVLSTMLSWPARLEAAGGRTETAVAELARGEALSEVPEEYQAACAAIDLEALPLDGMRWAQEVAFAFDVATGRARVIGHGLSREEAYAGVGPTEVTGTADVVGISADGLTVLILDWKTGRTEIARASRNWQMRFLSLAATRAYGAVHARVALVHVKDDGLAWFDAASFDAFEVDGVALELAALWARVAKAAAAQAAGRAPDATTGEHCRWCPSLAYCPAQTALVRQVAGEVESGEELAGRLTADTAARAWERVKSIKAAVKRAESALYTFAAGSPIPLPGGLVLGPVETTREEVDGEVAVRVMEELFGPDVARRACDWSTSKAAIERALRPLAASGAGKITHLKRDALAAIGKAGGITRNTTTSVREHVPDNRAAAQVAADMAALAASLE